MTCEIQIIDPTATESWDRLLLENGETSFFHSAGWALVLSESYKYAPFFFSVIQDGRLEALIPCMEVSSVITGKRGVSLPFTDYCEPLARDEKQFQDIFRKMTEYGKRAGWKAIELRAGNMFQSGLRPSSFFYGHTLDLSRSEEEIFRHLRDSTRRNIRKAVKEDVEVTFHTSADSMREFYRLNCITRKDHGLPPQPYIFFKKLHEHVLSKDLGQVALASHNGKNIAGAVYFHFGDKAVYKFGASERSSQNTRANNLVMWMAIRRYHLNGYRTLCFGRTEPGNQGLLQFKRGWGAEEHIINYYKYDLRMNAFIEAGPRIYGFHNKIFRALPMSVLKITGSLLYRHMG